MGYAQSFSSLFPIPNCPSSPDPQVMIAEALEAIEFVGKSACLKLKQVLKLNCDCEGGRVVCVSVSLFFSFSFFSPTFCVYGFGRKRELLSAFYCS